MQIVGALRVEVESLATKVDQLEKRVIKAEAKTSEFSGKVSMLKKGWTETQTRVKTLNKNSVRWNSLNRAYFDAFRLSYNDSAFLHLICCCVIVG